MAIADRLGASAFKEALPRILPNRLEQPVATACVALLHGHEALVDERGQVIEHSAVLDVAADADALRRVERPSSGKYRQPPEQELLRILQEVVAPVDERAQRLLARQRCARSSGQEPEAMIQ